MSSKLNDLSNQAILGASINPAVVSSSQTGAAIDLDQGDGLAFASLVVGSLGGSTSVTGKIQQSDNLDSWTDIADATFASIAAANTMRTIRFTRTQRYARAIATVSGGSPSAGLCALIGQQKKLL